MTTSLAAQQVPPRLLEDPVLEIEGGARLHGEVRLPGAKNAALPALVAACLSDEPSLLENVPVALNDVRLLMKLLRATGATVRDLGDGLVECSAGTWSDADLRNEPDASRLRHSLLLLGGAAGRGQRLALPLPGGCRLGERRHDLHVYALRDLGFSVTEADEALIVDAKSPREGAPLVFHYPTFGGTLNVLYASVTRNGVRTTLRNAARNPEILDVIDLLNAMGARIRWEEGSTLVVDGVEKLVATRHRVMADRIVASTLIAATAATAGTTRLIGASLSVLASEAAVWKRAGIRLKDDGSGVEVTRTEYLRAVDVTTRAYPGFHTDIQPLHGAMMTIADGVSRVRETILDGRFAYAAELAKMGADVRVRDGGFTCVNGAPGQILEIRGVPRLTGAEVRVHDIRGGGALVIAGLMAEGTTRLSNLYQLERGYHQLPEALAALGARVTRRSNAPAHD